MAKKGRPKKKTEEPKKVTPRSSLKEEIPKFPQALLDRAKKEGLSDEQIESLDSEENLKALLDQISPETNPDALPKVHIPEPKPEKPKLPLKHRMRKDDVRDEQKAMESFIRKINIMYRRPELKTVTKQIVYDCQKREIVTADYITE